MEYLLIGPEGVRELRAVKVAVFARPIYGIGLPPEFASYWSFNLPPDDTPAVAAALTAPIPTRGTTFAIAKAGLDEVSAIVVLLTRHVDERLLAGEPQRTRIGLVAEAERSRGRWRPITRENPWPNTAVREVAAIDAVARDAELTLAARVALVQKWLLDGEEPAVYREDGGRPLRGCDPGLPRC